MKKYTKIGVIFIGLSLVVAIIGAVFGVLAANKRTIQNNIVIVKNTYTTFSIKVVENYRVRSKLIENLEQFSNDTYPSVHETYVSLLTEYNKNMTEINANLAILEDKCSIEYEDTQTTIFCENYQQLYEAINNEYIGHLNNYNNKITSYNEISEEDYDTFPLINTEIIDFNKDGAYDGKLAEE